MFSSFSCKYFFFKKTIFLITYVGTDVSSVRSSIKNAYVTIIVIQRYPQPIKEAWPLDFVYLRLSLVQKKEGAEVKQVEEPNTK